MGNISIRLKIGLKKREENKSPDDSKFNESNNNHHNNIGSSNKYFWILVTRVQIDVVKRHKGEIMFISNVF